MIYENPETHDFVAFEAGDKVFLPYDLTGRHLFESPDEPEQVYVAARTYGVVRQVKDPMRNRFEGKSRYVSVEFEHFVSGYNRAWWVSPFIIIHEGEVCDAVVAPRAMGLIVLAQRGGSYG